VTDADLVLGYLDPNYFLGGAMQLDLGAAKKAFDRLGVELSVDGVEAARGVRQIVDEQMATATQMHIAERGGDPAKFAIVATGGAGPVHAMSVARSLGLGEVVFPIGAGVASALGLLVSPVIAEQIQSMYCTLADAPWNDITAMLRRLEEHVRVRVAEAGADESRIEIIRTSDMRYIGQGHEIRVSLPAVALNSDSIPEITQSFEQVYEQLYGLATPNVPIEILSWRVTASAEPQVEALRHVATLEQSSAQQVKGERRVFFAEIGGEVTVPVYDRYALRPGDSFEGPAIVEERESTAIIGPAASVHIDDAFNVRVTLHSLPQGGMSTVQPLKA
jgi:N-methylhydantoinase A